MITLFIIFLFVLAGFLFLLKYIKPASIIFLAALILLLITASGLWSFFLLKNLEPASMLSNPDWGKENAIVVLGGGTVVLPASHEVKPAIFSYPRIHEAARLYLLCKQKFDATCKLVMSGGDAFGTGKSEASVYHDELLSMGVKEADMILETQSMNTYKNAEFTYAILKSRKFDRVVLVTSGIHMKRALLYFSHFGIDAIPAMSDYIPPKISVMPLSYHMAITDFAIHEVIGIIRFHIYNYMGWNGKAVVVRQAKSNWG